MWTLLIIIFVMWLLGFSFEIAGNLIHILLVIALVLFIFRLMTGKSV